MLTRQGWVAPASRVGVLVCGRRRSASSSSTCSARCCVVLLLVAAALRAGGPGPPRVSRAACAARVHAGDAHPGRAGRPRTAAAGARRCCASATRSAAPAAPACSSARCARASRPGPPTACPTDAGAASSPSGRSSRGRRSRSAWPARPPTAAPRARADRLPPRRRASPRRRGGRRPRPARRRANPNVARPQGDDFYALRDYVVGDDLRRVHWPSTARHDELMVRQDEMPWQGRATVLLDVRRAAHTAASLELAVSAAASVDHGVGPRAAPHPVHRQRRRRLRLRRRLAPHRGDHGVPGPPRRRRARLAAPGARHADPRPARAACSSPSSGRATPGELDTLARLRRSFRTVIAVVTEGPVPRADAAARAGSSASTPRATARSRRVVGQHGAVDPHGGRA